MRAVVFAEYGGSDRLELREVEKPAPGKAQLLVRVRAAAVNPADGNIRRKEVPFFLRPKLPTTLGFDVAGDVEAVGPGVTRFRPGDAVFGLLELTSGGGYADFAVLSEASAALKPASLTYEEAAAVPVCGLTALQALRDLGGAHAGDAILVHGASGGVGTFSVQIGLALGATVTATCGPASAEMVRALGATAIIDYSKEDFARRGDVYDLIFDAVAKRTYAECAKALKPGGTYITTVPSPALMLSIALSAPARLFRHGRRPKFVLAKGNAADLEFLAQLVEAKKLRPVIDRTYPLAEARAAHDYLEAGHTHGKVVLQVA